jgi:hypothetical protein
MRIVSRLENAPKAFSSVATSPQTSSSASRCAVPFKPVTGSPSIHIPATVRCLTTAPFLVTPISIELHFHYFLHIYYFKQAGFATCLHILRINNEQQLGFFHLINDEIKTV